MSAYDIRYATRQALKAQALADFIAELTPKVLLEVEKKEEWKVWIDGTSRSTSSGVGILLLGMHLIKLRHVAKLKFDSKNNRHC